MAGSINISLVLVKTLYFGVLDAANYAFITSQELSWYRKWDKRIDGKANLKSGANFLMQIKTDLSNCKIQFIPGKRFEFFTECLVGTDYQLTQVRHNFLFILFR